MESSELKEFRIQLTTMLEGIRGNGDHTRESLLENSEMCADPADRATAESDKTFLLRLRDRERHLLRKIEEAIERIDDGVFGICEDCGEDISIARLKARPMTQLCIECKSRQEEEEQKYNA